MKARKKYFSKELMRWNNSSNNRKMPWKGEKDPYKIWLSEIILQQTRVEQGLTYYNNFVSKFPNVKSLAEATENKVYKLWEGLGYYSRCRNLISTSKIIAGACNGIFPSSYDSILALPGIGPYTAAAISSFAYNLPYAVVDGNVFRVLSRFFGISISTDSTEGKKYFSELANELLDNQLPGKFNQAIMDFGATVCKPVADCQSCPLSSKCTALLQKRVFEFPVKGKRLVKKNRYFTYFIVESGGKFLFKKRESGDIWQSLHEFVMVETPGHLSAENAVFQLFGNSRNRILEVSAVYKQALTHQSISAFFIRIEIPASSFPKGYRFATGATLRKKAFPQLINQYLADVKLF